MMSGWSPQRAEIENKQFDLQIVNEAISQLSSTAREVSNLGNDFSNLASQIQSTYRTSGSSGENYMITRINEVATLAKAKLETARSELQDEIHTLQAQERAYFMNERRRSELAAKNYAESMTKSNMR